MLVSGATETTTKDFSQGFVNLKTNSTLILISDFYRCHCKLKKTNKYRFMDMGLPFS